VYIAASQSAAPAFGRKQSQKTELVDASEESDITMRGPTGGRVGCDPTVILKGLSVAALNAASEKCVSTTTIHIQLDDMSAASLDAAGASLDAFLGPRSDWRVSAEPYAWMKNPSNTITLERSEVYGEQLRTISANQYPGDCDAADMFVVSDQGRFFGSLVHDNLLPSMSFAGLGPSIVTPFFNENWYVAKGTGSWCKEENKWDCYFLPLTNCTVPKGLSALLHSKNDRGEVSEEYKGWATRLGGKFARQKDDYVHKDLQYTVKMFKGYNPTSAYHYLTRPNYRTRSKTLEMVQQERLQNPALQSGECVAVHARRGDKISPPDLIDPHNPAFWQFPGFNRTFSADDRSYMATARRVLGGLSKFGIVGAKDVFFMTDDGAWLAEKRAAYAAAPSHGEAQVHAMAGHDNPFRTKETQEDELYRLLVSINTAAGCKGAVGNSVSNLVKVRGTLTTL
jgi:hypothetical protein